MNTLTGLTLAPDGTPLDVDPVAAMLNPSAFGQALHMGVASYLVTGGSWPASTRPCSCAIATTGSTGKVPALLSIRCGCRS